MLRVAILALLLSNSPGAICETIHHNLAYCGTCPRDKHGRIKRSQTAKHEFKAIHPCPATGKATGACPGYVIDHIVALKRGGADDPGNMQWQTVEDSKVKDKIE